MSLKHIYFTKQVLKDLKEISDYLDISINDKIINIFNKDFQFKNLKIMKIITTRNDNVDNPDRIIKPKGNSEFIVGKVGSGKTTFFDKILHPFYKWTENLSPINKYVNYIEIYMQSDKNEKYDLNYTTIDREKNNWFLKINNKNTEESVKLMETLGLSSELCLQNFICLNETNIGLLSQRLSNIKDFRKNFYNFNDSQALQVLNDTMNIFEMKISDYKATIYQTENSSKDLKNQIKDLSEKIENIKDLLKIIDKIPEFLNKKKKPVELINLSKQMNQLNEMMTQLNDKASELTKIKDDIKKKNYKGQKKYEEEFLAKLYQESHQMCYNCNALLDFNNFKKAYQSEECYVCHNKPYTYKKMEPFKTEKFDTSLIDDELTQIKFQQKPEIQKKISEKKKLIDELSKEDDLNEEEKQISKIMSKFYTDLKNKTFDLKYERKLKSRNIEVFSSTIEEFNKEIENKEKYIEEISKKIAEIDPYMKKIKEIKDNYVDFLERDSELIFNNFISDIIKFWRMLTEDPHKDLMQKGDEIFIYTISKNNVVKNPVKLKSLNTSQKRLSSTQVNMIRYAVILSYIKQSYLKYKGLPLKTIIIDDPDPKCIKKLVQMLNFEFAINLGFQILIIANEKNEVGWENEEFEFYKDNKKINTVETQKIIDDFTNSSEYNKL